MNKLVKRISAIVIMMVLGVGIAASYMHFNGKDEGKEPVSQVQAAYEFDLSEIKDGITIYEIVPSIKCAKFSFNVGGSEIYDFSKIEGENWDKKNKLGALGYTYTFCFAMNDGDITIKDKSGQTYTEKGEKKSGAFIPTLFNLERFKSEVLGLTMDKTQLINFKRREYIEELRDKSNNQDFKDACNYTLQTNYQVNSEYEAQYEKIKNTNVTVKTYLTSYINKHPELLDKADMVVFTGKDITPYRVNEMLPYLKDEIKEQLDNPDSPSGAVGFGNGTDITAEVAAKLFENATDAKKEVPIIMYMEILTTKSGYSSKSVKGYQTYFENGRRYVYDGYTYSTSGYDNNVYKLYLMLFNVNANYFRSTFYDDYITIEDGKLVFEVGKNRQDYWCEETFREAKKVNGKYTNLIATGEYQLSCYNSTLLSYGMIYNSNCDLLQNLLYSGFISGLKNDPKYTIGGFYLNAPYKYESGVKDFFVDKNGNTPSSITPANAISYLLFGVRSVFQYEFNVLEVEPSSQYKLNEALVRKWIYRDEGIMNINITRMTMDELNSSKEDLAATYHMIYFGDNIGGLSSKYTDTSLNKYVYFHTGDAIDTSNTLAAGTQRFSGNDITEARKNDVTYYANAGYPIVMADSIYNGKSNNKIDKQSNVYALVTAQETTTMKNDNQIVNEANFSAQNSTTAKDMFKHVNFERPGVVVDKDGFNQVGDKTYLDINFRISNIGPLESKYNAYLFIDSNGDGIIEESKKDSTDHIIIAPVAKVENKGKGSYTLECEWPEEYPLSAYYEIALAPAGTSAIYNTYKSTSQRSDTTQVVAQSVEQKTVRVLQIDKDATSPIIDLTNETDYIASLAGSNKTELHNYNFKFDRITTSEFEALYEEQPYGKDDLIHDRLLNYDVIVFGFSDSYPEISNANGALDNVIQYIEKSKSAIFTNSVLDYRKSYSDDKTKKAYDTLRLLAGMTRYHDKSGNNPGDQPYVLNTTSIHDNQLGLTYTTLLNGKQKNQCPAYNFGTSTESINVNTNKATKINEGSVNYYPYEIKVTDQSVSQLTNGTADTTLQKDIQHLEIANTKSGSYQLDMEQPSLIGYYALNDSNTNLAGTYSVQTNDMRNNYYLYHNKTVWYSGIGKSALAKGTNEMEAKLFINTLVAAYEGGVQAPTVEYKNVLVDNKGNYKQFVNVDFGTKETSSDIIAYFKCIDSKKVSTGMKLHVYVINNQQSDYEIKEIYDANADEEKNKYSILSQKITLGEYNIESGKVYAVKIPKDRMSNNKAITLKIFADNKEAIGFGELQLLQRNLYDYD